jgi:hypothetical protein
MYLRSLLLLSLVLMMQCSSTSYTKQQLHEQVVPDLLIHKTWVLSSIVNDTAGHQGLEEPLACHLIIRFLPRGVLEVNYRDATYSGTYLIEGEHFNYVSSPENWAS